MATYRFFGALGYEEIESTSPFLALSQARFVTSNPAIGLQRRTGNFWSTISFDQMLLEQGAKQNLKAAFGSCGATAARTAERLRGEYPY